MATNRSTQDVKEKSAQSISAKKSAPQEVKTSSTQKSEVAAKKPIEQNKVVAKTAEVKTSVKTELKPNVKPVAKAEVMPKASEVKPKTVEKASEVKPVKTSNLMSTVVKDNVEAVKPKPIIKKEGKSDSAKKLILYVASEVSPFSGTGGLGEVMGSLPKAINTLGGEYEARVISPLYESFPFEEREKLQFICHINVPLAWRNQYCGLFQYNYNGTIYYFIDNEYYFKRPNLYGYYDDGERFAFLSRAVVELIPYLDKKPAVLHCHDWQTALVPIYYKLFYMYREGYNNIKTIFTIHNIEYQGKYAKSIIEDVFGIPYSEYISIEYKGCINLMKGAIDYSDLISTVSPTYAQEIMIPFYAHGLENVLLKNSYKLCGILNGIDTLIYDSSKNTALFKNYDLKTFDDKYKNKEELQKMLSLPVEPQTPIIAIISRLVTHKGLDLIRCAMNEILKHNVQIVLLGKGDPDYEGYFAHIEHNYRAKVSSVITFNKDLSQKIYAGSDMFLMPSKSEPCGLSQMIACRYGTVPIVRATGGLKDSIKDCENGDVGNGFVFNDYDSNDMLRAIERALGLYNDYSDKWAKLARRAYASDFTWGNSAKEYVKFYSQLF